jgi:hypothetical protein
VNVANGPSWHRKGVREMEQSQQPTTERSNHIGLCAFIQHRESDGWQQ